MKVFELGGDKSDLILIQMADSHSIRMIESEAEIIRKLSGRDDFRLVACQVDDWNRDLSPWEAPPVFGKEGFGGKAEKTLQDLKESVLSRYGQADRKFIGGTLWQVYSLSGRHTEWNALTGWHRHLRRYGFRVSRRWQRRNGC